MAIIASTSLASYTVCANGVITFAFVKQIMNGDTVLSSQDHVLSLTPMSSASAALVTLNAQLTETGFPAVSDKDTATVMDTVAAVQTPEVVAAYAAGVEAGFAAL